MLVSSHNLFLEGNSIQLEGLAVTLFDLDESVIVGDSSLWLAGLSN